MPDNEKITSPEQLNDYIHVTAPGAWLILSSILIFLTGFLFWVLMGRLEVSFSSYMYTEDGSSLAFISPDNASRLKKGMTVRIANSGLSGNVEQVDESTTPYRKVVELVGESNALMMGLNDGDKLMKVAMHIQGAPERVSRAVYVVDTVRPLSFLLK